jgi:hypothetical protein
VLRARPRNVGLGSSASRDFHHQEQGSSFAFQNTSKRVQTGANLRPQPIGEEPGGVNKDGGPDAGHADQGGCGIVGGQAFASLRSSSAHAGDGVK